MFDKSKILGTFNPEFKNRRELKCQFKKFLKRQGVDVNPKFEIDVFDPNDLLDAYDWHQDTGYEYIIVWSNKFPTEVKLKSRRRLETQTKDVILINNLKDYHRTPLGLKPLVAKTDRKTIGRIFIWSGMPKRYD